jgi:hypothetical protein
MVYISRAHFCAINQDHQLQAMSPTEPQAAQPALDNV